MDREIILQCYSLGLSPEEIKSHIPVNVMAEIKNENEHPYFRAYSTMHEGIARPRVIGEQNALPTKWTRNVIQAAKKIIKKGVQFFVGHGVDNSTDGRHPIGKVVATFQKNIGNKLHNIAIGYFPDKIEADKYNICSIEGDVIAQDYDDYSEIKSVKKISAIALGNESYEKPAFPGAIYLGAIQAFDDNADDSQPSKQNTQGGEPSKGKEITMTFEDVKKAVKDMNIHVSQLYSEDDVKKDNVFSKTFDDVAKAAKEGMISKEDYEKELNAKEDKIKKLEKDVSLVTAQDKLKTSLPEGLTELQKNFINKKFDPKNMEDLSDDSIKKFVDTSVKEYADYAELFNVNNDDNNNDNFDDSNNDDSLDEIDKIVNEVIENKN